MTFLSDIQVKRPVGTKGEWELTAPLIYQGRCDRFTVPLGFKTDFASIPRIFSALIPKNGSHDAAAILHDFFYREKPQVFVCTLAGGRHIHEPIDRKDADGLFRRIMKELGVNIVRRNLMYYAVRIGGRGPWNA